MRFINIQYACTCYNNYVKWKQFQSQLKGKQGVRLKTSNAKDKNFRCICTRWQKSPSAHVPEVCHFCMKFSKKKKKILHIFAISSMDVPSSSFFPSDQNILFFFFVFKFPTLVLFPWYMWPYEDNANVDASLYNTG